LPRYLTAALATAAIAFPAHAEDDAADVKTWRFELKRQNTGRGTEDESTRTTLRLEYLPVQGALSQLRLDVPLPDAKTSYAGSPFDPRLGDIKIRASARPMRGEYPWIPYVGITFPTADPEDLGSGKYQLSPGVRLNLPWKTVSLGAGPHNLSWGTLVEQVVSFRGDAERKDINYTKFELSVRDGFGAGHSAKATFKPNVDWVQDGKTGAVLELEGSTGIGRDWRVTLMGGHLLWGSGVQGTYGKRLELTLATTF
jgi:hypothetical protein